MQPIFCLRKQAKTSAKFRTETRILTDESVEHVWIPSDASALDGL